MDFALFDVSLGKYRNFSTIQELAFLLCDYCHKETPQLLSSETGFIVASCSVCGGNKKFPRFVVCNQCQSFVQVVGLVFTDKQNFLIVSDRNTDGFCGGFKEKYYPVAFWDNNPVVHNDICARPLNVKEEGESGK